MDASGGFRLRFFKGLLWRGALNIFGCKSFWKILNSHDWLDILKRCRRSVSFFGWSMYIRKYFLTKKDGTLRWKLFRFIKCIKNFHWENWLVDWDWQWRKIFEKNVYIPNIAISYVLVEYFFNYGYFCNKVIWILFFVKVHFINIFIDPEYIVFPFDRMLVSGTE